MKLLNLDFRVKLIVGVLNEFLVVEERLVADGATVEPDIGQLLRDLLPAMRLG